MLQEQFDEIIVLIKTAKKNAVTSVNRELIELYWSIGEYINNKLSDTSWGKGVVKNLSEYINSKLPDTKGFSSQNLWRMNQFYETYGSENKLSAVLRELSWTNN